MTFMQELKEKIKKVEIPKEFTQNDLKSYFPREKINELANYDKKNDGSSNKNKKVLKSMIKENGTRYYWFD